MHVVHNFGILSVCSFEYFAQMSLLVFRALETNDKDTAVASVPCTRPIVNTRSHICRMPSICQCFWQHCTTGPGICLAP
jgi:hypothetical protein